MKSVEANIKIVLKCWNKKYLHIEIRFIFRSKQDSNGRLSYYQTFQVRIQLKFLTIENFEKLA